MITLEGDNDLLVGPAVLDCRNTVRGDQTTYEGSCLASAAGWDGSLGVIQGHCEWPLTAPQLLDGVFGVETVMITTDYPVGNLELYRP
ncbi:MAG: hypothetical protein P1V51_22380 [Deltaproteobacteria bacterium]|nr:hypothetical protein [Deltaproteobacteria bacterium]